MRALLFVLALAVASPALADLAVGSGGPPNVTTATGTLPVANGGTGLTSPGISDNVLISNGTAWTSGINVVQRFATPSRAIIVNKFSPTNPATDLSAVGFSGFAQLGAGSCFASSGTVPTMRCDTTATANAEFYIRTAAEAVARPTVATFETVRAAARLVLPAATASERVWAVVATSADTIYDNDAMPAHYCGIRYSTSASDTQWQCCSGDGTNSSCSALGARDANNVPARYEVDLASAGCTCRIVAVSGAITQVLKSTNLPTGAMFLQHSVTPLSNSAIGTRISYLGID